MHGLRGWRWGGGGQEPLGKFRSINMENRPPPSPEKNYSSDYTPGSTLQQMVVWPMREEEWSTHAHRQKKKMRKFFVFHNITYKRKSLIVVISRREMNAMYFLFFFRFQWRQFYWTWRFAWLYEGNTTIIKSFVGLSIFLVDFHYNNVYFKELT